MKLTKVKHVITLPLLLLSLAACSQDIGAKSMNNQKKPEVVYMDVSVYAYTPYVLNGMTINGRGLMTAGGGGLVTGEVFDLGPQTVQWRTGDTGEIHTAKNTVICEN
ncbi:hypothetical protein ACF3NA_05935 [Alkanindiges sp. WGS2144]|uniref:hypothetical protein n=1 Tax=Alkanindiges sp. WGS2144 TaxID=3366808 RepID=UPI0037531E28